jgi:hypothetical protein
MILCQKIFSSTEIILSTSKGGLLSESLYYIQKNVPNHYPEHYPPKENMLSIVIWYFFGDGAKVKTFLRLSHLYQGI